MVRNTDNIVVMGLQRCGTNLLWNVLASHPRVSLLGLVPDQLPQLRLKSKNVRGESGEHNSRFGELNRHYWFGPEEIATVVSSSIDSLQESALSPEAREIFVGIAGRELIELGYE